MSVPEHEIDQSSALSDAGCTLVWDDGYLSYDLGGHHPMHPIRWELTLRLAREFGVLERMSTVRPDPATHDMLCEVHDAAYVEAVVAASGDPSYVGYGMGTPDNPVFAAMHTSAALIAGGSARAAELIAVGSTKHAVNIAGGLHHAMRGCASGFCVYNDAALAIATLLRNGVRRVAYLDVDVHHGDGVQTAFYADPRVLTVSLHESPQTLFPGTGYPDETGSGAALGTAVNVALPAGTDDSGWLRAFHAVAPSVIHAFGPDVLVLQAGCDSHREDPLANLELTVDGQRASYLAAAGLADELCGGRLLVLGGGGYGLARVVPRAWTHLLAIASGAPVDPSRQIPESWSAEVRRRGLRTSPPVSMTDGGVTTYQRWQPGGESPLDRAITASRAATFPLLGLDPDDPRD
ncbi:MAG TPA: acetoin utilization protein AcuC [Mycobacteriales bacterium]|nr:acetoin utilization protein AcuC [Mycobacteriales bacterium]